jgi:hypothetical protein
MEINNTTTTPAPEVPKKYTSLEQIRDSKGLLQGDLRNSEKQIQQLWGQLFTKPEPLSALTPTKRFSSLLSTGAGILDGVILGWKLYRKFKRKK